MAHGVIIHLEDGWARFSPVAGRPAGVYLTIHGGKVDDRVIGASTPIAGRAEIHTHTMTGGVMRMEKIDGIAIPKRGEVILKPGGLHIMLFDVKETPKPGSKFPLTLTFATGKPQTVNILVRPIGAAPPKPAAGHGDHQH